jgi:hypothetical protein
MVAFRLGWDVQGNDRSAAETRGGKFDNWAAAKDFQMSTSRG